MQLGKMQDTRCTIQIQQWAHGLGCFCPHPQPIVEFQSHMGVLAVLLLPFKWTIAFRKGPGGGHRLLRTPRSCSSTTCGSHEMWRGNRCPTLSRMCTTATHWIGCAAGCRFLCHAAGTACSPSMPSHSAWATSLGEPSPCMHCWNNMPP